MGPSVDGTIALLRSAQQYGWVCYSNRFLPTFLLITVIVSPEIKRVVLTSTSGNVMEPKEGEYTWTEVLLGASLSGFCLARAANRICCRLIGSTPL